MAYQIQTRKDTTANWASSNPILADGEIGIEWTGSINKFKTGNAVDDWSTLPYSIDNPVTKIGVPVDNQVGVWTGDGTLEGTSGLTYDGSTLDITGDITLTGTVDGIDIAVDVAANTAARFIVVTGIKLSASDAGKLGEISVIDDYMYICVQAGTAGNAIWRKTMLFTT